MRGIDLTGQQFGKLTAIQRSERPKSYKPCRKSFWLCNCECGKQTVVISEALRKGRTKSCGCLKRKKLSRRGFKQPGLMGLKRIYRIYRSKAKKRGLSFRISLKRFKKLTKQICYYCGKEPSLISSARGTKGYSEERIKFGEYIYNGIDRVNNKKGYTNDNCVPSCIMCNRMISTQRSTTDSSDSSNVYLR